MCISLQKLSSETVTLCNKRCLSEKSEITLNNVDILHSVKRKNDIGISKSDSAMYDSAMDFRKCRWLSGGKKPLVTDSHLAILCAQIHLTRIILMDVKNNTTSACKFMDGEYNKH